MSNTIQIKRGTNLSNAGTPAAGELIFDSGNNKLYVGDGSTAATGLTAIGGGGNSTATSSFLTGDSLVSYDGYIMVRGIVNENETGSSPAAITFGDNATYGTDQISLITAGARRLYVSSNGNVTIAQNLIVNGTISGNAIGAVSDGATTLATGDAIYDHVTSRISGLATTASLGDLATLDDIPANKVSSGTLLDARIPNLAASKITSGVVSSARMPATFGADSVTKDDITTRAESGFYQTASGTTGEGWPITNNSYQHMIATTHSNDSNYYSMQIAGSFYDQNFYGRKTNGSGTTSWLKFLTTADEGSGNGLDADTLDGNHASAFLTSSSGLNGSNITSGIIASARLDADTAHLSGTQTFSGAKTFSNGINVGGLSTGGISGSNYNITGVNAISFSDPGAGEGLTFSNFQIFESPDNLTNAAGNIQFVTGGSSGTRRATIDTSGNLYVQNNITLGGTVDGRDVASDGSKLDGIASGATANTGDITGITTATASGLTGGTTSGNATLVVDHLTATDDRDVKPSAITFNGKKQVRAYFTSLEGLTGTAGSNWQDLLVLSTYSDNSGGDVNALAFDKSTQEIKHYLADQTASTWGTAKTLAYTDSTMTGTWQGTAIASAYIADNAINAAKLNVSGNGTNGQVLKSDGDGTFSWFSLVSSSNASTLDNLDSTQFLRSDANDTASGQYSFTKVNDHAIKVGTIRGTAVGSQTGQFIQLYERVNIGGPSGWGATNTAAPANGLSVYGGADLATDTGDVTIGGNLKLTREKGLLWDYTPDVTRGGYIAHPGGGMYRTSSGAHTGAIAITLPSGGGPADMVSFWVDVFDYVSYESQSFFIAGYVYQTAGSNEWVNETAMMLTPKENHARTVRFGHNGTNHVVYIGELADTWSYPQVTVRNVQVGYVSDVDLYNDNWDISFEASAFGNVDATYSGADTLPSAGKIKMADGAGKFVHNTTSSRDKIRVWNSSAYAIGMQSPNNYGGLVNQYAMTFSMDSTSNRGFLWVKNTHSQSQGAMALTTDGKATIAHSLRLGYGESDTTTPGGTATLETKNSGTGLAGYFENTSSNGTVMQLKTTGDNSSLYLQTDHIYGSGSLHLGSGTNQNIYRGSSHTFQVGSGNTTNMTLNSNQLLFAQPTRLQFANDQRIFDNGSGGLSVGAESHELRLYSGGTDPIEFRGGGRNGTTRCTITHDGQFTWGSAADYGRLTWDTGKAIISSQGSNNLEIRRVNTSDMISLEDNDIRFIADGTERFAANQNGLDLSAATANKIVHTAYGSRDKYRVWNSSYYCIGMDASYTFGGIGSDYVMTFQMNDSNTRGFWWGDDQHTDAQGAMSLTTNGKLAVAHSMRLGYGESDTTTPGGSYALEVSGHAYASSSFLGADGSAGTPSYRFHNDGDSGMYKAGANQLGFSTGGNTRLLIQAHKTYINSTGANGLVINNDEGNTADSGRIFFEGTSTTAIMQQNNDLSFRTGATTGSSSGTERFLVNTSGATVVGNLNVTGNSFMNYGLVVNENANDADFRVEGSSDTHLLLTDAANNRVGIGTASPSYKLDITHTGSGLRLNSSGDQQLRFERTSGNAFSIEHDASRMYLYNRTTSAATVAVTNAGDFGVGTVSPTSKVHIYNGNGSIPDDANNHLLVEDDGHSYIGIGGGTSSDTGIHFMDSGGIRGRIAYKHSSDAMDFKTANAVQMTINSSGNVGIGVASPSYNLHVKSASGAHAELRIETPNDSTVPALSFNNGSRIYSVGIMSDEDFVIRDASASWAERFAINTSGDIKISESLGIGVAANGTTGRLDCSNDVVAYASSDKRLKENIKPLDNALDKVLKISGVEFDWKELTEKEKKTIHGNEGHDVGVIAQEIEEVLPEVVTTRDNGYKAVKYEKIVPLLIEAIKEQQQQINKLQEKLNG